MATNQKSKPMANGVPPAKGALIGPDNGKPLARPKKPAKKAPNFGAVKIKRKKPQSTDSRAYDRAPLYEGRYGSRPARAK
jgi:hypothetical protein